MLWSKIHLAQKVRIQMKQSATQYFRKSDPTQGEGDASRDGLGFLPI